MRSILAAIALVMLAATVSAQTRANNAWARGTTLQISAGAAADSPTTTATFGTALGWELTHRLEIEGGAAWLRAQRGHEGFGADLRLLVNLAPPRRIVPYVSGGGGLYRAAFDTIRRDIPRFYQSRLEAIPGARRRAFTDPTLVIAAGSHVYVGSHFSVRPEAAVRLVVDDRRTHRVTAFTVGLVYHVEPHPYAARVPGP